MNGARRIDLPPSDRELDVLAELAQGKGNKGAAAALGIREQTVKNHVYRLSQHTGQSGVIAVLFALGWIKVPSAEEREIWRAERALDLATERAERARDELDALLQRGMPRLVAHG